MKIGDIVRFLNDVGGGRISRIDEKKKIVYVEDADGFEIPVLPQEVVVVDQGQAQTPQQKSAAQMGARPYSSSVMASAPVPAAEPDVPAPEPVEIVETPEGETLHLLLSFVPQALDRLQTTDTDCLLINDSNYFVAYNLATVIEGRARSVASGMIEPNMQETLYTLPKTELNDWAELRVQAIAFKQGKDYEPQSAVDVTLKLSPVKFYKLHCFTENDYFDTPAMVFDLQAEQNNHKLMEVSGEEIRAAMLQKEVREERHESVSSKPKSDVIEVDLHMSALLDDTTGMSAGDMLQYQMAVFHRTMREHLKHRGQKIVFIHGKGEGVLRAEIEKALRLQYKYCKVQDASFRQYGFGATMVTI